MLLQIDSKQEVKWATVLFPPDIDDIIYCSVVDLERQIYEFFVFSVIILGNPRKLPVNSCKHLQCTLQ